MWNNLRINYLVVCGMLFVETCFANRAIWEEFIRVIIPPGREVIILADGFEIENECGIAIRSDGTWTFPGVY